MEDNDSENTLDDDDYLELEFAQDEQAEDSSIDLEAIEASLDDKPRLKALRQRMNMSEIRISQSMPFLAVVQLDLMRRQPIGLKELFIIWLEKGNSKWLNPFRKYRGLDMLEEVLLKYQGDLQILRPFITLLKKLSGEKISPASFVSYVLLPRMQGDYNWRKWSENHLEALNIIADLIISAKSKPPFNRSYSGSGQSPLLWDIVLVRYIGQPIARYSLAQLSDKEMLNAYQEAWQKISLNNSISIYFMRYNVLNFIYAMSGKIDLIQLTAIITQLPDIERSFIENFPRGIYKIKKIQDMNLFNYDIHKDLHARERRGYHSLDFTEEVKAYLNIIKTLFEKNTGVYLCAYYARLLQSYKDPVLAIAIEQLVRAIDDRGGMYIYKWHTKKLLSKIKTEMLPYIEFIIENNGCDPEYPIVNLLFRNEETALETQAVLSDAESLGLQKYFAGVKSVSYKDLFNAYIIEYPENKDIIADYQQQLLSGEDRLWTSEYLETLDQLSPFLHRPLLRSVIRGIGTGFSFGVKSANFSGLLNRYVAVQTQKTIDIRTTFNMPIKPLSRVSSDKDVQARKQINLLLIEKIWTILRDPEPAVAQGAGPYIYKQLLKLENPLEKASVEQADLEKELQTVTDEELRKQISKKLAKKTKTIQTLQTKKQEFTAILDVFEMLNNEQKFIAALIIAGTLERTDEEFAAYAIGLLLQRYIEEESIVSRITFLKEDVSIDALTYEQLSFLLNLLETLFFVLREDKKINTLLNTDKKTNNRLHEILRPYIITKKKQVTADALDAAAKKITGYAALQEERAKWQSILDKLESKDKSYFHQMELYTSKTFMDSYYGDMGGICLSGHPEMVRRPGFFIQRLADKTDKEIIGMSILFLSDQGFSERKIKTKHFWQVFAFNPLSSVLYRCNLEQQLYLYLQFRLNMEKLAWQTKLPVLITGIDTSSGLISNSSSFGTLIHQYETSKRTARKVYDAKGLAVYYDEVEYAYALVIIDPRGYENTQDIAAIPTFYAHRELQAFDW